MFEEDGRCSGSGMGEPVLVVEVVAVVVGVIVVFAAGWCVEG